MPSVFSVLANFWPVVRGFAIAVHCDQLWNCGVSSWGPFGFFLSFENLYIFSNTVRDFFFLTNFLHVVQNFSVPCGRGSSGGSIFFFFLFFFFLHRVGIGGPGCPLWELPLIRACVLNYRWFRNKFSLRFCPVKILEVSWLARFSQSCLGLNGPVNLDCRECRWTPPFPSALGPKLPPFSKAELPNLPFENVIAGCSEVCGLPLKIFKL